MSNSNNTTPVILPKNVLVWILANVARPIAGFEHKRTQDGTYISPRQQLYETYYQVMLIATYFYKRGDSEEKIVSVLSAFTRMSH